MPTATLLRYPQKRFGSRSMLNRRVGVRQPCSTSLASRIHAGAESRLAIIRNISTTGIAFAFHWELSPGTLLLIELSNKQLRISYDLGVRVAHSQKLACGRWLVGCAFVRELTPVELETLL